MKAKLFDLLKSSIDDVNAFLEGKEGVELSTLDADGKIVVVHWEEPDSE